MIYTLTLNPSIDYIVAVDDLKVGGLNRTREEEIYPGGKGINVSLVLSNLGVDSVALGYIGGFTGAEIERLLQEKNIHTDFIHVEGNSRINVKARGNGETEINGSGPVISDIKYNELMKKLEGLTGQDILVIAGAIPSSMPADTYLRILEALADRGVKIILDASGDGLKKAIKKRPYLIKPNNNELGDLFGVKITSKEKAYEYAYKLQQEGARNILVSLGGEGSILLTEDGKEYSITAPKGEVINTIGAGDSLVAGFIAGMLNSGDMYEALKLGVCTGSASAFSLGMATKEQVEELLKSV